MAENIGTIDRIVRTLLGLALIIIPWVTELSVFEASMMQTSPFGLAFS